LNYAEPKQSRIEQGQRGEDESYRGKKLNRYFCEFETPRERGLVMCVGQFAAKPGKKQRRSDKCANGERDQYAGFVFAESEKDQHGEHVAHIVIVKHGKELTPE
jgi:hypothetical protein